MSYLDAIILGTVQGLTEFLPVSSSGHLVLFQRLLHVSAGDLSFEVAVHVGTLVAVLVFFRQRLLKVAQAVLGMERDPGRKMENRRLLGYLVWGTIPAAIVGLAFKSRIEALFASPRAAAAFLMVTGAYLLLMSWRPVRTGTLTWVRAGWIGVAQAAAILPGISRSGSTIATGVMLGVDPTAAAEYSFLLSIPAIVGAAVLALPEAMANGRFGLSHILGMAVSAIVGYMAIRWVFAALGRGRFGWFGLYCLLLGALATVWLW